MENEVDGTTTIPDLSGESCRFLLFVELLKNSNIIQVLVIGILNRFKVHILQGHFDGCLNVRQSDTYEFQVGKP